MIGKDILKFEHRRILLLDRPMAISRAGPVDGSLLLNEDFVSRGTGARRGSKGPAIGVFYVTEIPEHAAIVALAVLRPMRVRIMAKG
jgi:hypothetical protein